MFRREFDPDQPRDEDGKWTDGGGGGGDGGGSGGSGGGGSGSGSGSSKPGGKERGTYTQSDKNKLPKGAETEAGAEKVFQDTLKSSNPVFFHEAPGDVKASIEQHGLKSEYGVFAAVNETSNFVVGGGDVKTVVQFEVPKSEMHLVGPDMSYTPAGVSDNELDMHQQFLAEHGTDFKGAYVSIGIEGAVPKSWVKSVEVVPLPKKDKLTADEKTAVTTWVEDYESFESIQSHLRDSEGSLQGLSAADKKLTNDLTSAISKNQLSKAETFSRGFSVTEDNFGRVVGQELMDSLKAMEVGDVFTEHGFMATSSGTAAEDYGPPGTGQEGAMMIIRAPAGTPVMKFKDQGEHLFQRDTQLRLVDKDESGEFPHYTFDMMVVGYHGKQLPTRSRRMGINRSKLELAVAKQLEPEDDESEEEFMQRCTDEIGDEDVCQLVWDTSAADETALRYKTTSAPVVNREFIMSDESMDRMQEIIMSDGWVLDDFKKNPIALFGHNSNFIVGRWKNVRVVNRQLRGTLEMAPDGTSERIDELRRLIDAGILRAVSVGFRPKKKEPIDERADNFFGPFKYLKQDLIECSLVSVPANPNALSVAKKLNISPETIKAVFGGQASKDGIVRKGATGGKADTSNRGRTPMSLSQKIAEGEKRLVTLRDQLKGHLEAMGDDPTDEQMQVTRDINAQITRTEQVLGMMKDSEKQLATGSVEDPNAVGRSLVPTRQPFGGQQQPAQQQRETPRPFILGPKKLEPIDLLVRAGVVQMFAHIHKKAPDAIRQQIYGNDEVTKTWCDIVQREIEMSQKAATAPAMTSVTGWAAELVQTVWGSIMETLYPKSIFPRLSAKGLALTFGRSGKIIIPTRSATPSIAGSFVGEGLPIPVRQGAFTSSQLTPKKMAVITTWTREIDEMSIPAIEGVLRAAIQEDTSISLDSVLIDTNPATLIRPPGLLNGVTPLTATAGGGFTALVGDIKALSGALLTATKGNVRSPVWLMNPQQVMSAGLTPAPGVGAFPFQDQTANGNLQGWPIIDSGTVPLGTVIAMDAADFVAAGGDAPRFEVSDQATLHMEDTTPADIISGAAPGTPATPVKSMFQTDSIALRLILPVNWSMRRAGVVAAVTGVTW